jgi:hypothetical protein
MDTINLRAAELERILEEQPLDFEQEPEPLLR